MKFLCLNTAGVGTQICVDNEKEAVLKDAGFSRHSEALFPILQDALKEAGVELNEIKYIGVVTGPGSFTGIRIGLAVAKTFAYVLGIKCVAVNSLEVLAYNITESDFDRGTVCAVINAGGGLVYHQAFELKTDEGGRYLKVIGEPTLSKFEHFQSYIKKAFEDKGCRVSIIYNSNNEREQGFESRLPPSQNFTCSALHACVNRHIQAGEAVDQNEVAPIYLRISQAEKLTLKDGNWTIKLGTKEDLDALSELESQGDAVDLQWNRTTLEESFENPNYLSFILFCNSVAVGYVSILDLNEEYEILRLVVLKKARLQGVAWKLLEHLARKAREAGVKYIYLEVNDRNFPAAMLYEKFGFEKIGERAEYYSKDENAVEMRFDVNKVG